MMLALQSRYQRRLSADMPVIYWMVEYAGELLNRFVKDSEGRTVREKKYGKVDYTGLVEFGECVYFLPQVHHSRREKFEARFKEGVFLGVRSSSNDK